MTPVPAGFVGTMPIRGRGVREIDRKLMYSAAWLDHGRPDLLSPEVRLQRGRQAGASDLQIHRRGAIVSLGACADRGCNR